MQSIKFNPWALVVILVTIYPILSAGSSCDITKTSCGDCVGFGSSCTFCKSLSENTTNITQCAGGEGDIMNPCGSRCDKSECYQHTCLMTYNIFMITVPSVCVGVLLILAVWIWCCCCRKSKSKKLKTLKYKESREEKRERSRRQKRSDARREARNERTAEIRAKYGIKTAYDDNDDDDLIDDEDY